jgi:hypothetical protein
MTSAVPVYPTVPWSSGPEFVVLFLYPKVDSNARERKAYRESPSYKAQRVMNENSQVACPEGKAELILPLVVDSNACLVNLLFSLRVFNSELLSDFSKG